MKKILYIVVVVVVSILCGVFIFNNAPTVSDTTEIARIGGIEIGTDSLTAVNAIKRHFNKSELTYKEDDYIGYSDSLTNEHFYVKINQNKVYSILYINQNLPSKEISIESKGQTFSKTDSIYKICKDFIIEYNGKGVYKIHKR